MGWVHYTLPLSPGQLPTREQRNELVDAFIERVIVFPDADLSSSNVAEIKASHSLDDRILVEGLPSIGSSHRTLMDALGRLSTNYNFFAKTGFSDGFDLNLSFNEETIFTETAYNNETSRNVLALSAKKLGLSFDEYRAVASTRGNKDRHNTPPFGVTEEERFQVMANYFNVIREALTMLVSPALVSGLDPVTTTRRKSSVTESLWSDAVNDFVGNPTDGVILSGASSILATFSSASNKYTISRGDTVERVHEIPNVVPFSSGYDWKLIAFRTGNVTDNILIDFESESEDVDFTSDPDELIEIDGDWDTTGTITLEFENKGTNNSTALDLYEPSGLIEKSMNGQVVLRLYPNFAYSTSLI